MNYWVAGVSSTVGVTATTALTSTATTPTTTAEPVLADLEVTDVNNQIPYPMFAAALPSGEAAVVNMGREVVKVNNTGGTVKVLYDCITCDNINGLLLLGSNLHVIHRNGTVVKINPHTGDLLSVYHVPEIGDVGQFSSLWFDPSLPDPNILPLADYVKGEVFSYNLTSGEKQVHVTNLDGPSSVSYIVNNTSTDYIVCDADRNMISIYDSRWNLYSSFEGNLNSPLSAIMSSNNTIIVCDSLNDRISVFTTEGDFLYHLSIQVQFPFALSYFKPYLWISHGQFTGLLRHRLDQ